MLTSLPLRRGEYTRGHGVACQPGVQDGADDVDTIMTPTPVLTLLHTLQTAVEAVGTGTTGVGPSREGTSGRRPRAAGCRWDARVRTAPASRGTRSRSSSARPR